MSPTIPESDWKRWRKLTPVLLDRFCQRVLQEAGAFADRDGTPHENYHALFKFVREADRDVAAVFDAPSRSSAILKIAAAFSRGIITREELAQFSEETRVRVERICALGDV